jgi:anti-sigma regulatory factor (Ser/Thr protein kinase)
MTASISIIDRSQIGEARQEAASIARRNAFKEYDSGRVSLVATELSSNLIKHGRGGELLIGAFEDNEGSGIELLAIDQGPGIGNLEQCLRDGYSSAGTAGNGLGAIIRQAQLVDIASWPGLGTGVLARIQPGTPSSQRYEPRTGWGAVSVAMPGQDVCGDSWSTAANGATTYFVADGLGHGQEAANASVEAVRLFHRFNGHRVPTLLDYVHGGLRSTRGAAVSIARFDPGARRVTFAGVGNVAGAVDSNGTLQRMVTMPGTAGHNVRKIQSFDYPFERGLIVLASDGISTGWDFGRYPGIQSVHPALIAAILYRDFGRKRDDATVLVGKRCLS